MSREARSGAGPGAASEMPPVKHAPATAPTEADGTTTRRPSLGGGKPAQDRELRKQGRETVRKLLEAGLAEFDERGFQAVRVDDIVRRAQTSHGTFYLYFANKEDLFKALLRDALDDMAAITDAFPVVTRNETGRKALRKWVHKFCDAYAAHAAVIRSLSQAELVSEDVWGDGLQLLFRLAEAMAQGMTAASPDWPSRDAAGDGDGRAAMGQPAAAAQPATGQATANPAATNPADRDPAAEAQSPTAEHAELTALACLMMLERVNYLLSVEVRLPREEMADRLTAIMFAAFGSP